MTEPLQVGQFAIVDGEPVDRGPNAGIFHGKGPTDDRAELLILAEGTTPAGDAFAGHVVSALGQAWNTLDMSLTGSLTRLFEDAERNLHDWNRKSIAQHRVSLGLTCFGRRGGQAVIAQAGPSAVFHVHHGQVAAYFTDEEHGRPIGSGPVVPQLTRIDFVPGDRLLMVSTVALRLIDDEILHGILTMPNEQVLPELYHRVEDVRESIRQFTVMLVNRPQAKPGKQQRRQDDEFVIDATGGPALPEPEEAEAEPVQQSEGPNFQPSLFIDDQSEDAVMLARRQLQEVVPRPQMGGAVPAMVTEIPAPLARVSGESPLTRIAAERRARAALAQAAVAEAQVAAGRAAWRSNPKPTPTTAVVITGGNSQTVDVLGSGQAPRRRHDRKDSFSRGLVREDQPPTPPDVSFTEVPLVNDLAAESRARQTIIAPAAETIAGEAVSTLNSGGSLVRVRGNMGGRWKGGGNIGGRRTTVAPQLPPTWLVIVVGLGILLTLVGVLTVPRMLDQQSSEHYTSLLDGANQRITNARVQQDPAEKRKALSEANAMLLEAQAMSEAGPEAGDLLKQVKTALDVMDAVKAPAAVDVVGSLEQFGDKPVNVARLTVSDDTAYILDTTAGQVIAMALQGGERKVIYTEDKDAKRARPIASAYLDGGDGGLLVADATNQLWAFSPTSALHQVSFNLPANLKVTDIATSGRDLYVLDAAASAVYKLGQVDGGFGGTAIKVLETPDLAAARRLMVDGDIVTSDANGTIHRFAGQLALTLSEGGIDKRLVAAESPQSLQKNGDLFLLDSANDRITVFRRDGAFDRQYKHKDFHASSAFATRNGTGYLFSDGKLRKITF